MIQQFHSKLNVNICPQKKRLHSHRNFLHNSQKLETPYYQLSRAAVTKYAGQVP
jgi:hypothetical protein